MGVTREYWNWRDPDVVPWVEVDGPWQHEPDKVQWTDEPSGLPCLALRNALGFWCGYVGVGPGHALYGTDWTVSGDAMDLITVTHGITYSDGCQHGHEPEEGICHVPEEGEGDDVWWFGFACDGLWDEAPYLLWLRTKHPEMLSWRNEGEIVPRYRQLLSVQLECAEIAQRLAHWEQLDRSTRTMPIDELMRKMGIHLDDPEAEE